jgi:hypothetical protein
LGGFVCYLWFYLWCYLLGMFCVRFLCAIYWGIFVCYLLGIFIVLFSLPFCIRFYTIVILKDFYK